MRWETIADRNGGNCSGFSGQHRGHHCDITLSALKLHTKVNNSQYNAMESQQVLCDEIRKQRRHALPMPGQNSLGSDEADYNVEGEGEKVNLTFLADFQISNEWHNSGTRTDKEKISPRK